MQTSVLRTTPGIRRPCTGPHWRSGDPPRTTGCRGRILMRCPSGGISRRSAPGRTGSFRGSRVSSASTSDGPPVLLCHPAAPAVPTFDKNQLMPLIPEEPQIHESAQGPRATPASGRTAPTPRPVPGPRPAAPSRPGGRPGPLRPTPPAQRSSRHGAGAPKPGTKPGPTAQSPAAPAAATPQIQLIPASAEGALDAAEEAVDLLLDSGRAPGDVLVITTGEQHPWAAHELS